MLRPDTDTDTVVVVITIIIDIIISSSIILRNSITVVKHPWASRPPDFHWSKLQIMIKGHVPVQARAALPNKTACLRSFVLLKVFSQLSDAQRTSHSCVYDPECAATPRPQNVVKGPHHTQGLLTTVGEHIGTPGLFATVGMLLFRVVITPAAQQMGPQSCSQ